MQGRGSHSHRNALKTFECHSTNVALSLCQFACLLNKLTSELGNFFTDAMRDSNSHEFEEIVDPFTLYLMRRSRSVLMRLMRPTAAASTDALTSAITDPTCVCV